MMSFSLKLVSKSSLVSSNPPKIMKTYIVKVVSDDSNLFNATEACAHFSAGNRMNNFELSSVSTVLGTVLCEKRRNVDHTLS